MSLSPPFVIFPTVPSSWGFRIPIPSPKATTGTRHSTPFKLPALGFRRQNSIFFWSIWSLLNIFQELSIDSQNATLLLFHSFVSQSFPFSHFKKLPFLDSLLGFGEKISAFRSLFQFLEYKFRICLSSRFFHFSLQKASFFGYIRWIPCIKKLPLVYSLVFCPFKVSFLCSYPPPPTKQKKKKNPHFVRIPGEIPVPCFSDPFHIITKMPLGAASSGASRTLSVGLFIGILLGFFFLADGINLWPMPKSVTDGSQTLYLGRDFELTTYGSKYSDGSGILKDAFQRMVNLVQASHIIDGRVPGSGVLAGVNVVVLSSDDQLNYGIDESYKLSVPTTGNPLYAHIEAQTVFGALHALQTFSQLCYFNFTTRVIELYLAPWTIFDEPRFLYRGLLIDTSRHYLPMPVIKHVIDSMTYSKLNVLHWHIVDTQSFPLEIPSYPRLWNGAYSYAERYTMADAQEIVQYAERRGINVLAEIDVPGHALSWGIGYPSLWPAVDCQEPLDVSNEFTFEVIDGILSDFSKVFKFKFVHLGGDEVNTSCWTTTPRVKQWLKKHSMNESDAYQYIVLRAQKIALSHGYEVINWEETFNNFGNKLNPKTVVHNWLGGGVAPKVVAAGLRCLVSNQDSWYLDHLDSTWQKFYMNEPLTNISKPEQQKLVIGGEVCMWGEHIDTSDIEQTIWPRAAAAAERLWTPLEKLAKDPKKVTSRLARFRCLLNQRGVAAAPLAGPGRVAPIDPGSCLEQ